MDLYELRFGGCGLSRPAAADWLGLAERTLRRQESGASAVSGAVLRALELRAGYMGAINDRWHGWRLAPDGLLYAPGLRDGFAPGDVMALPYWIQLARSYQARERQEWESAYLPSMAASSRR